MVFESHSKFHDWVKSTLGHGEVMCSRCRITYREAAVLGLLNICQTLAEKTNPVAIPVDNSEDDQNKA